MKPPVDNIRISKQGRDQLMKLKKQTGIQHWNVLCRWSLCASLRENSKPHEPNHKLDGGVEMTWRILTGDYGEIYAALIYSRAKKDGVSDSADEMTRFVRSHIERGLTYLASGYETKSISDFTSRWAFEYLNP